MLKRPFLYQKFNKAFTLVETLVVIFIFTLAMGAVSGFIVLGYRTQSYTWEQSQAIYEARKGIETMVREIRTAQNGEDGAYVLWQTENYQFGFYSDVDRDGQIEKVRYFLEGTNFKKGVIEPVGIPVTYPTSSEEFFIISQYVTSTLPFFRYFDGEGEELSIPARKKDTKMMEVNLVINVDPNRPSQNFALKSRAQIRNLKREF
jgi:prepilin-type N-terminal cleavage/methylation domain-containing protein